MKAILVYSRLVGAYAWGNKPHPLGTIREPLIIVPFLNPQTQSWVDVPFKIDSGAVVTAIDATWHKMLGYKLTKGIKHQLRGVSCRPFNVYQHKATIRLGTDIPKDITFVFKRNLKNNLLGMIDVFDLYRIDFIHTQRHTVFST